MVECGRGCPFNEICCPPLEGLAISKGKEDGVLEYSLPPAKGDALAVEMEGYLALKMAERCLKYGGVKMVSLNRGLVDGDGEVNTHMLNYGTGNNLVLINLGKDICITYAEAMNLAKEAMIGN